MVDDGRPEPPNGRGEVLEWNRAPTLTVLGMIGIGSVLLFVARRRDTPLLDLGSWVSLPLLAIFAAGLIYAVWHPTLSVGESWVQMGTRWVDTSELTRVSVGSRGRKRWFLTLEDASGRRIRGFPHSALRGNPVMLDLVRSKVLDCAQSGQCDISTRAQDVLDIPRDAVVNERSIERRKSEDLGALLVAVSIGAGLVVLGIRAGSFWWTTGGGAFALVGGWLLYRDGRRRWGRSTVE